MPASKPQIREDLTLVELDQEAIVYDPLSGFVHYLNPMASLVMQLCDGTATVKETVADLAEAQETTPQDVGPQVLTLMRQFRKLGLVEPSRGAEHLRAHALDRADERQTIRREVPRSS
jgi:PqqD family protein of HPr-rel-A system